MATITFTVTSPVDGTLQKTYTLADADLANWFDAMRALFNLPGGTNGQAALAWANNSMAGAMQAVQLYLQKQAASQVQPVAYS